MGQVYWFSLLIIVIYITDAKGQQQQFSFSSINPNSDIIPDRHLQSQFPSQIPYLIANGYNEIPQKFMLPHSEKLSKNISPMPMLLTSTVDYGDENLRRKDEIKRHINITSIPFNYNQTKLTNKYEQESKTSKSISPLIDYKHSIERMDTKVSSPETFHFLPSNQNPMSKNMIISMDNGKNHEPEQRPSYHNVNFSPTPKYYLQSTTEPAIPILRLSNEMDLDGSFSYEALGADQTHYVQHSRMENLGTDKEGPIVEGSYSYVGDDGQTYTVHYIADSNGYRATGDHLPVPPPIPEIIQRSIQYNLAEEIKQEPDLKYYNEHINDSNVDNEKSKQYFYRPQRKLFTGQTPKAFSFGSLQAPSSIHNMTTTKNFTEPIKTSLEIPSDNTKRNINYEPLEPQVTFRALQGAHSPLDFPQKPLPQLVHYEPDVKETENAKALWRWQYGLNTNTDKPNILKDSISRSFTEGDDIIINFNEMTPEEYTKIIKNYETVDSNADYDLRYEQEAKNYPFAKNMEINNGYKSLDNKEYYHESYNNIKPTVSTIDDYMFKSNHSQINNEIKPEEVLEENKFNFIQTSEKSPNWYNHPYEPKVTNYHHTYTTNQNINSWTNNGPTTPIPSALETFNNDNSYEFKIIPKNEKPNIYNQILYGNNNIQNQEKYEFKPIKENQVVKANNTQHVTIEESAIQEELKNNVFLKNILMAKDQNSRKLDYKKLDNREKFLESVTRLTPINTDHEANSRREIDPVISKAFDITNVLNLIDNKNIFESNRLLVKRKPQLLNNINNNHGFNLPSTETINREIKEDPNIYVKHYPHEIRGPLKNYKVLQRNNIRNFNTEENPSQNQLNKGIYSMKLPSLGRAGPSMKTYQPPLYL